MRFSFHPDAEAEFDQAVDYYETRQSGLGLDLADEVLVAVARILDYPKAGQPFSKNTRRCLAKRFPLRAYLSDSRGHGADHSCRSFEPLARVLGKTGLTGPPPPPFPATILIAKVMKLE